MLSQVLTRPKISAAEAARIFPGLKLPARSRQGCRFMTTLEITNKKNGETIRAAVVSDSPLSFQQTKSAAVLFTGASPWLFNISASCEAFDF